MLNGVGALISDVGLVVAGPVGYGAGVTIHNAIISPFAIGVDALALTATTISGAYTGENAIIHQGDNYGGTITIKVSQDTIVASTLFVGGILSPEPNLDTAISGAGAIYDLGRLDEEGLHNLCCGSSTYPGDNFVDIPTVINPSFSVEYEWGGDPKTMEKQRQLKEQRRQLEEDF
jgi:hypothetical protein